MRAKIFAMVTTGASARYTPYALRSFFEHTTLRSADRFMLIDNDCDCDPGEFGSKLQLIKNGAPLSFAENANRAIDLALSEGTDLYFLNNDIILTPEWLAALELGPSDSILTPLSNREVQYNTGGFVATMVMSLEDYLPQAQALPEIAKVHRGCASGYRKVTALPFFCVKIPLEVLRGIGHFDTVFGRAGGEDYDYCLRAYLAGFEVNYALQSYVLHFGGKSSWSGAESKSIQDRREFNFRVEFGYKWGEALMKLLLFEDREIIKAGSALHGEVVKGNHRYVIEYLRGKKSCPLYL